jgi:hypothetical protein
MHSKSIIGVFTLIFAMLVVNSIAQGDKDSAKPKKLEKIAVEEIVSKHLASIGTPEDIIAAKTRVMTGDGTIVSKLGSGFTLTGPAQFASDDTMVLFAMAFESEIYPYEKLAFDGKDQSFGLPSGKTTFLGAYMKSQNSILREGLFGGALSSAWTLTRLSSLAKPKLSADGSTVIDGRSCYKVTYASPRTGELKIALYFDGETFRHIRTEYEYSIQGRIGTSPTDVRSSSSTERYKLREDFGDFRPAGKLTLPHSYVINIINDLQIETRSGTISREWNFRINNVYFDQKLEAGTFKVS